MVELVLAVIGGVAGAVVVVWLTWQLIAAYLFCRAMSGPRKKARRVR
jgi:hypothetical protein